MLISDALANGSPNPFGIEPRRNDTWLFCPILLLRPMKNVTFSQRLGFQSLRQGRQLGARAADHGGVLARGCGKCK